MGAENNNCRVFDEKEGGARLHATLKGRDGGPDWQGEGGDTPRRGVPERTRRFQEAESGGIDRRVEKLREVGGSARGWWKRELVKVVVVAVWL